MTSVVLKSPPSCSRRPSAECCWSAEETTERGQDTSRKVRPVGRGRKASKSKRRAHLVARRRKLSNSENRQKRSTFSTLRWLA